jgi:clan AA aspartic protease (TIGR02281 family)
MRIGVAVLAACVVFYHRSTCAQSQSDAEFKRDISQIHLHAAPDETSVPLATVPRDEIPLTPVAQVLGTGGVNWYLVKTRGGIVGWMSAADGDGSARLESFFKSLPAEISISSPREISLSAPNATPFNAIVIPIQTNGSAVIVPVVLNRAVQTNMILDTGASFTVVSQHLAARLGLMPTRRVSLVTANGTVGAPMAPLGSLKVGEAEATNLTVVIQDSSPTAALGGLLGLDFLSRYYTSIDTRRQLLVLAPR